MHVLVVCDSADEGAILSFALKREGVVVTPASDLEEAMRASIAGPVDLVVLSLRQGSLAAQVRRVRRDSEACLVLVSGRSDDDDFCEAFQAGADAIIPRPYSVRVLTMQIKALLRRSRGTTLSTLPSFRLGKLTLDPSTRTAQIEGQTTRRLTQLEFRLLYVLMLHHGQTLPTETVVERVWGYDGEGDTELVRGLVRRLRVKLEPDPKHPQYIITVPTLGYRIEIPED